MNDDLMKLLEAQDIDLEIDKLSNCREEYPARIQGLRDDIEDQRQALADLENVIAETKESRTEIQSETAAERENLAKKEKRLLETKTNKEYNAVQSEIEQARNRIDTLESEEIELIGRLETLEPQVDELKTKLEETVASNTAQIAELEKSLGSLDTDIAILAQKRATALLGVNKRLLAMYTRLRKGRDGVAVSRVTSAKYSCTGCYKRLPPQRVLEVRRANSIINCENCGRILVWDDCTDAE